MNPEIMRANDRPGRTASLTRLLRYMTMAGLLLIAAGNASAMDIVEWRFQTSLYTKHWDPDPEHENNQKLLNIEFETSTHWVYGFAWLDNSFGQPSQYLYAGYSWPLFKTDWAYFKLTGGLLHGYKEPYDEKIPLNQLGIAPVIVPTFGFKYKRVFTEIQILGTAAIGLTAGFNFGHKKSD
jgi:hypothetical protein